MAALSKMFPSVTFEVTREGEESPDFEVMRFKDGQVESVKGVISYPPFKGEYKVVDCQEHCKTIRQHVKSENAKGALVLEKANFRKEALAKLSKQDREALGL